MVAEEVIRMGFRKPGILGTKFLMEGPVYPEKLEYRKLSFDIPKLTERIEINRIIFSELVYGKVIEPSRNYILSVIEGLKSRGCDSVILGCTELPLIIMPGESHLPVLDSTRILARAALKYSLS
jgi:aspartate racemase